jgi:hypothetical protein
MTEGPQPPQWESQQSNRGQPPPPPDGGQPPEQQPWQPPPQQFPERRSRKLRKYAMPAILAIVFVVPAGVRLAAPLLRSHPSNSGAFARGYNWITGGPGSTLDNLDLHTVVGDSMNKGKTPHQICLEGLDVFSQALGAPSNTKDWMRGCQKGVLFDLSHAAQIEAADQTPGVRRSW